MGVTCREDHFFAKQIYPCGAAKKPSLFPLSQKIRNYCFHRNPTNNYSFYQIEETFISVKKKSHKQKTASLNDKDLRFNKW